MTADLHEPVKSEKGCCCINLHQLHHRKEKENKYEVYTLKKLSERELIFSSWSYYIIDGLSEVCGLYILQLTVSDREQCSHSRLNNFREHQDEKQNLLVVLLSC